MHDRSPAADAGRAADAPRAGTTPASAAQAITPLPGDSLASKTPPTMPVGLPLNSAPLVPLPTDAELASLEIAEEALDSAEVWIFVPSWLASVVVHLVLVLLLALLTTLTAGHDGAPSLVVSTGGPSDPEPELLETNVLDTADEVDEPDPLAPQPLDEPPIVDLAAGTAAPVLPSGELLLGAHALGTDSLMSGVGGVSELKMRLDSNLRQTLLEAGGGTAESEAAVQRALQWLAEHQAYDGSWSFQHDKHPKCHGQCGDNGYTIGHIAATGLALLPFLGAGQTQHDGPHKRNVELGLKYLVRTIKHQGKLGSLWDPHGTMYGHGLASIALCEAYGMTHDQWLRAPTQSVVNFICEAQDPNGGGWRYHPQTPGDTSVVGWQLMALKSAQMAYLDVPQLTFGTNGVLPRLGARPAGSHLRLSTARLAAAGHHVHRSTVPYVPGLEPRRSAAQARRAPVEPLGPVDRHERHEKQHVLQLLRHAGHAPLRRFSMAALERRDARVL